MIGVIKFSKAVELYGGSGTIQNRKRAFYMGLGFSGKLADMEKEWLASKGFDHGTLYDRWYAYLGSKGFEGRLPARLSQLKSLTEE